MQQLRLKSFTKKSITVFASLLVSVSALVAGVWAHQVAADPTPIISGTLRFNGNPAPLNSINNGVDVAFVASNGVERGAQTNASGQYVRDASQFGAGNYTAQLSYNAPYPQLNSAATGMPNSYLLTSTTPVFNYTGDSIGQDFEFNTKTVTVTVKDHNGDPVAGRTVRVTNVGTSSVTSTTPALTFSAPPSRLESQGVTNANGVATVAAFEGPTYSVCAATGFIYQDQFCTTSNLTLTENANVQINYPQPPTISGQVRFNNSGITAGSAAVTFTVPSVGGDNLIGGDDTDTSSSYSFNASQLFARQYGAWIQYNVSDLQQNSAVTGVPNTFLLKSNGTVVDYAYSDVTKNFSFATSKLAVAVKDANGNPINTHVYVSSVGNNTVTTTDGMATFTLPNAQGQSSNHTNAGGVATVSIFNGVQYNACALIQNVEYCTPVNINGDSSALIAPAPAAPSNLTAISPTNKPILNWSAAVGAQSYKIYRDNILIGTTTSTTFTDTTASDGTRNYFVKATNAVVEGQASNNISVLVDTVKPTMTFTNPTNFSGPFVVGPNVTVTAVDANSGLQILVIHVYTSSNQLLSICGTATPAQLAAGTMSCDLSSLPAGTYYIKSGTFDNASNNRTINSGNFIITG